MTIINSKRGYMNFSKFFVFSSMYLISIVVLANEQFVDKDVVYAAKLIGPEKIALCMNISYLYMDYYKKNNDQNNYKSLENIMKAYYGLGVAFHGSEEKMLIFDKKIKSKVAAKIKKQEKNEIVGSCITSLTKSVEDTKEVINDRNNFNTVDKKESKYLNEESNQKNINIPGNYCAVAIDAGFVMGCNLTLEDCQQVINGTPGMVCR